jgi:alpha-tubulin suppressor-like RCC1 family protein
MKAKKKVVATALVLGLGLLFGPRLASLTGWVTGEGVEADGSEYAPYYVDIHYLEDACQDLAYAMCGSECGRYTTQFDDSPWLDGQISFATDLQDVCSRVFGWNGESSSDFKADVLPLFEEEVPLVGFMDESGAVMSLSDGWESYDFDLDLISQACYGLDEALCGADCYVWDTAVDGSPYETDEEEGWVYAFESLCYEWRGGLDAEVAFPELASEAILSADLDSDGFLTIWIVENLGTNTWDGFNVVTYADAMFDWMESTPYDPTEINNQSAALLGARACAQSQGQYLTSNADSGDGTSWGERDATVAWSLEYDGTLTSGSTVYLAADCTDESCPSGRSSYLKNNSGLAGGYEWGDKGEDTAFILEYTDSSLVSGTMIYLKAPCLTDSTNPVCNDAGQYFLSNSAEGAGQSWGVQSYQYTWKLEWDGATTTAPTDKSTVHLASQCTGMASVWTDPDGETAADSSCLPVMTPDEWFQIFVDYGYVEGDPDSYTVLTADEWRGPYERYEIQSYLWGIDDAFHVVDNAVKDARDPIDNPDRFTKKSGFHNNAATSIERYVNGEECLSRGNWLGPNDLVSDLIPRHLLDAGDNHTCRLNQSSDLTCWGDNSSGQTNVPGGIFKTVAAGSAHTCALRLEGYATCWGDNSRGQTDAPTGRFKSISAMGNQTCALDFDGLATCWGDTTTTPPSTGFAQISVSANHACGLDYDNQIECWGSNTKGETTVVADDYDQVAVGNGFSCGLTAWNRTTVCWGDSSKKVAFDQNMGHYGIAAGPNSYCQVNRWHDAAFGEYQTMLCQGTGEHVNMQPWEHYREEMAIGKDHGCAAAGDKVYCWGNNDFGQTDVPSQADRFAMGDNHVCAVDGGRLQCLGDDSAGQTTAPPPYMGTQANFTRLTAGSEHTCGIRQPGKSHTGRALYCWGDNSYGQLEAPSGQFSADVSAGSNHTCAIAETDSSVHCWGDNSGGQSTAPAGVYTMVSSGSNHSCAIQVASDADTSKDLNGSIACWGDNSSGQTTVPSGSDWKAVFSGGDTSCAISGDLNTGSSGIQCWGDNSNGQATPPTSVEGLSIDWWSTLHTWNTNNPPAFAVGSDRTCGVTKFSATETTGSSQGKGLLCWGKDGTETYGSIRGFNHVDVQGDGICVREDGGKSYCWGDHEAAYDVERAAIVSAGAYSDAINDGIEAFRVRDASGNTCGSCHAPDGLDLAYHDLPEEDWKRRTEKHLSNANVGPVLEMLDAHRARYGWSATDQPESWRPMQPGATLLEGSTAVEKDAAFAQNLSDLGLLIMTSDMASTSDAEAALEELLALSLHSVDIGIELPLYSRDKTRGKDHITVNEWVPNFGHVAAPGKTKTLLNLEDTYLGDPSTTNFLSLLNAYTETTNPTVAGNTTDCLLETSGLCESNDHKPGRTVAAGNLDGIERQRQMSILILSHEMRLHMSGQSTGLFASGVDYPVNAFWNTGVLAQQSGEACITARTGLAHWDSNTTTKSECIQAPDPWNSEYTVHTHGGRGNAYMDLPGFGLPWRWMGFMMDPTLTPLDHDSVTPETTTAKKLDAIAKELTNGEYHTHLVFLLAIHRMHRFFDTDQSWRGTTTTADLVTEFISEIGMEARTDISSTHLTQHTKLVNNLRAMFGYLSSDI